MRQYVGPALRLMFLFTILTGLVYPLIVTGLCQVFFRAAANGSLIQHGDGVVGSALIGQAFTSPGYFDSRPSAAGSGNGYDPTASGGSNLGPTNSHLISRVSTDVARFRRVNHGYAGAIPSDLLTASGSGLDPDLSPDAAMAQVDRVARARGVAPAQVQALVREHEQGRQWGFMGEPRVNVLELNLALDESFAEKR